MYRKEGPFPPILDQMIDTSICSYSRKLPGTYEASCSLNFAWVAKGEIEEESIFLGRQSICLSVGRLYLFFFPRFIYQKNWFFFLSQNPKLACSFQRGERKLGKM